MFGRWFLSDTVLPVALVDAEVALTANSVAPLYGTPATAGELAAPAANTRLADTLALAAGNWTVTFIASCSEIATAVCPFRLRRRNAADNADVWALRCNALGGTTLFYSARFSIAASERFVIENVNAAGGGTTYQGSIFAVPG